MNRFKSIVVAAIVVVVAAAYAIQVSSVSAASTPSSASLSIAPKKNYVVEPGKSVKDKLTIRNLDDTSDLELTLRVVDFTYTDDGGTPKLFLAEDAPQTTWSLKPFLTVPKTVTVPKGGSKSLDMSVKIPAGHGAGSYYSAIVYSTGAPDGGNVGLAASGVTLAFVNVPGKVHEDLKLQKLGAYKDATASQKADYISFTNDEPQKIGYTLKNNGNVAESPVGSIVLKNAFFGQEYTITNVNPTSSLALIGQSRTFTACIKLSDETVKLQGTQSQTKTCTSAGLWPGLYNVKLDLFYGQNGNITQEVLGSSTFWYLPFWFIIIVLILLAVIIFLVWRLVTIIRRKLGRDTYRKKPSRKK